MEAKAQHIKRLRAELGDLRTEIDEKIELLDKLSDGIKLGYKKLEKAIAENESLTESKLGESMSTADVKEIQQVGEDLQTLLDKQVALDSELHELLMSGDVFYHTISGPLNNF